MPETNIIISPVLISPIRPTVTSSVIPVLLCLALALCATVPGRAHDEIPRPAQSKPIAFTNARLVRVSAPTLEQGTLVFDKGKITAIGEAVVIPGNAQIIDLKGKSVYPGFIAPFSTLGLVETEAVRATRDAVETGSVNPNVRGETAFNPDSEILPTVRSNGVLVANVCPGGGLVSGRASLLMLDGWTREDMAILPASALVVNFPRMGVFNAPWITKSPDEQRRESLDRVKELYDYFQNAKAYLSGATAGLADFDKDIRMESMREAFDRKIPVVVAAEDRRQILAAIRFAKEFNLRLIIAGAGDAWQCLEEIRESGAHVIIGRTHALPNREEEPYDLPFRLPKILDDAQIPYAFSDDGAWQQRNLPFQAGTAVGYGLPHDSAIRALTLTPARMFGVDSRLGSLDVGKDATFFVSQGSPLDVRTPLIERAYVQGREMSLGSKQTRLGTKYRERYRQTPANRSK